MAAHLTFRRWLPLLATAAIAAVACWVSSKPGPVLQADPSNPLADSDGDLLPDCVEWAVLTNSQNPDTDRDGYPDFLEVVTHGQPRRVSGLIPQDHAVRLVATSELRGSVQQTWLHLLFRFMGDTSVMTSFQPWLQVQSLPGLRIPLDLLANGPVSITSQDHPGEGRWFVVSLPLVNEQLLRTILPCTIGLSATIGGRRTTTGVEIFDQCGTTAALVPLGFGLAVQSLAPSMAMTGGGSNKLCVLQLQEVGSGPGGTVYQVTDADCDDANDLECGASCPETVGWVFVLPGGVETITGG